MSLFQVPGWNISSAPIVDSPGPRKRKRTPSEGAADSKFKSTEAHFAKLVKKLSGVSGRDEVKSNSSKGDSSEVNTDRAFKKSKRKRMNDSSEDSKSRISHPLPLKAATAVASSSERPKKKQKRPDNSSETSVCLPSLESKQEGRAGLTAMQRNMKHNLEGARFRVINESLYKSDSSEAVRMMKENPIMFDEYHTGFRHQVQSWPSNPVEGYITMLSAYPAKTIIADLGCGDAALARSLVPKGMAVLSFDLVADGSFVVEADICTRIPLPGSDVDGFSEGMGDGHVVDVAVCALSLMGTNWPNCVREAWRILKPNGELKIAEVSSRFATLARFTSLVESCGFKLQSSDNSNTHFTLLEFRKVSRARKSEDEWNALLAKSSCLKPCEYKRR